MRLFFLPTWATVLLDVLAWLAIHVGVSWGVTKMSSSWFTGVATSRFTARGEMWIYKRVLFVRRWKGRLPDAAPWFGGSAKKVLKGKTTAHLRDFIGETRRGEVAHWLTFFAAPFFLVWNPPEVGWVMLFYAAIANGPCIVVQRYNRFRLQRILIPNCPNHEALSQYPR